MENLIFSVVFDATNISFKNEKNNFLVLKIEIITNLFV